MVQIKSKILTFFVAFAVWLLLTWTFYAPSVIIGALIALLVAGVTGHLFTDYPHKWREPHRYLYFALFLFIFLRECFKANIDVALRVIKPDMPINPGIVKVKTRLKSEAALTLLANSITLTPGTLTIDVDKEGGFLYIHWINVKDKDLVKATNIIVKTFEGVIAKVFE
ncbi:MAG: Na+/H+ antiporter subunit E [Candidatus Omnitrophica bacterium]|nr:Na+/H+ antiporter subunit E [Candidatus Omnitrophota bacterium]